MRILNILPNTNLAGTEQASLRFMEALMNNGHTFFVFSLTPAGEIADIMRAKGIPVDDMCYQGKGGWLSYSKLKQKLDAIIRTFQPDIIMQTSHNILTTLVIRKYNIPKILAVHFHHTGVKPLWQWKIIYKTAVKVFDRITYPSEFVRNEAVMILPNVAKKAIVVRNRLLSQEMTTLEGKKQARKLLNLPDEALVIGNSSQLIKRKRIDIFLMVAAEIIKEEPSARFLIAGDGEMRQELEQLASKLKIADKIVWLGWQKSLANFYQSLDLLLFNSDWDAFPTTPLEAMAYGIPVVASAVHSGLKEVIDSEKTGLLLPIHDIQKLKNQILGIHYGKYANTGPEGRKRVAEVCGYEQSVEVLHRVLKEVADKKTRNYINS